MSPKKETESAVIAKALRQAKAGSFEQALALVESLDADQLGIADLRSLALVYSYCGKEDAAVEVWVKVCECGEVSPGDYYMLGSTQMGLGKSDAAIGSLQQGLEAGDSAGNAGYSGVTALSLAYLLIRRNRAADARLVIHRLTDDDSPYIKEIGLVTKRQLLELLR